MVEDKRNVQRFVRATRGSYHDVDGHLFWKGENFVFDIFLNIAKRDVSDNFGW